MERRLLFSNSTGKRQEALAKSMKHSLATFSKTYDCSKTIKTEDSGVWIKFNNAACQKLKALSKRKFWESDNGPPGDGTEGDDLEEPFPLETGLSSLIFVDA